MKLHFNYRNSDFQFYSVLSSKYLTTGGKIIPLPTKPKFLVTKEIVTNNAIENSWQAENDDLFSVIYLQILAYKNAPLKFKVNWCHSSFTYGVGLVLSSKDPVQALYRNIFQSSYIFRNSGQLFVSYRRLLIIKLVENQLLIKLLRSAGFYYAVPVEPLKICFTFRTSISIGSLKSIETSLRFNSLSVHLL